MADRFTKAAGKRMRLGTKSCSECRRRKVRCVFPPGSSICQGCAVHNVPCNAQQPRAPADEAGIDKSSLQQRIIELEGLVKTLSQAVRSGTGPDLKPDRSTGEDGPWAEYPLGSKPLSDAPLANLFRNALLINDADGSLQDDEEKPDSFVQARGGVLSTNLRPYIPNEQTIRSMLEVTRKYWFTWPATFYGSEPHESFQVNPGGEGDGYLVQLIGNRHLDASFCKALLWIALCIQQLPMDCFRHSLPNIPTKQEILTSYLSYCQIILAGGNEDSLDALQCDMLLFKLYINMGMPQKSWICTRSAVSKAILLGMNKVDTNGSTVHKMIWLQVWQMEKQLAMVLGYPSAIRETNKTPIGQLPMGLEGPIAFRILYAQAAISDDVINRDQAHKDTSYAETVRIDDNVAELRKLFPDEWSDPNSLTESLEDFYFREVTKFIYFLVVKFVHLPYMLKSLHDSRYEHSRQSALEAAREQIRCYVRVRNFPGAEILMCETMDFQAFGAGITLIIGALYMPSCGRNPLDILSEDGGLVESLIASLRQTSVILECPVAQQGARVLELLMDTSPAGDNKLELVVPYFGKLRVKMPAVNNQVTSVPPSSFSDPSTNDGQSYYGFSASPSSVEFSTSEFLTGLPTPFKDGDELRQDWFGILDTDTFYDWQETLTRMQVDG